jgi:enoyl-CoA hydratase/carnithine racemase
LTEIPALEQALLAVDGHVATVTMNRPEQRNALSARMLRDLIAAFTWCQKEQAVRVVVLTGAGDRAFCAGADLTTFEAGVPELERHHGRHAYVELFLVMAALGKPIVGRINGHALAGGLGLVVACDVAIAADDAQLGTPEINVGLWPMMIMATIFRNVPRKRGLELIMTGDKITAAQAAEMGLITRAVPRDRLEAEVEALAQKLASKSPAVMRLGLEAFYRVQDMELEPALNHLQGQLVAVLGTEDAREGLMAFMEKRAPQWKGR